jgi:hypothetical protein
MLAQPMLSETPQPTWELCVWTAEQTIHVNALDRPWYFATPWPAKPADFWEYRCRCGFPCVRVQRYETDNPLWLLWLAACPRCECIIWTQRDSRQFIVTAS